MGEHQSWLVISDIHGNFQALSEVLASDHLTGREKIFCLGDVVGYGARPGECIELLREQNATVLAGNHDAAVAGRISADYFNFMARRVVEWTRSRLSEAQLHYLENLPTQVSQSEFCFYHGGPERPLREYVETAAAFREAFQAAPDCRFLGLGHTHKPRLLRGETGSGLERERLYPGEKVAITEPAVAFNPGSVGQPRDGDPRASFCRLEVDSEPVKLAWHRLEYEVERAQEKIIDAGLPHRAAERLRYGQ